MRNAPAYSAERFPGDFCASAVGGLSTGTVLGVLIWGLARRYLLQTYPYHLEMLGAAVMTGLLDGALLACLSFVACFAIRIWIYERKERRMSDEALRRELQDITRKKKEEGGPDGVPFGPAD